MSENVAARGADVLGGAVGLSELFPPEWMVEHTDYDDVEAFFEDAGASPVARAERRAPTDDHVASTTRFDGWSEMLGCALDEFGTRRRASPAN